MSATTTSSSSGAATPAISSISALQSSAATTNLSSSTAASASLNLDSSEFLTLLTAELKYQDPNAPTDPTQMVAQLATFSMVSEQNQANLSLSSISSQLSANSLGQAASLIGKTVGGPAGSYVVPSSGTAPSTSLTYNVTNTTLKNVAMQVTNASGTVVSTTAVTGSSGALTFNGQTNGGLALPAGSYTLSLIGTDSTGTAQTAGTLNTTGTVQQILQGSSGAMELQLNNGSTVASSSITSLGSS